MTKFLLTASHLCAKIKLDKKQIHRAHGYVPKVDPPRARFGLFMLGGKYHEQPI